MKKNTTTPGMTSHTINGLSPNVTYTVTIKTFSHESVTGAGAVLNVTTNFQGNFVYVD